MISCEVNQTESGGRGGGEYSDDNVPSDKSGHDEYCYSAMYIYIYYDI